MATYPDDADTPADLIVKADEGLYRSKAAGKNRITLVRGERRLHHRVATSQPITLGARGRRAVARAKNVSEGGLLVSLKEPVPVGASVSVVIRDGGSPAVGLRGEVVRVDCMPPGEQGAAYDVGVRFLAEPGADAGLVLRRVRARA